MLKNLTEAHKKIILSGIVVVMVLYIDFSFILGAQIRALKDISYRLSKVHSSLRQYKNHTGLLKSLQADLDSLKAKGADAEKNLFSDFEIPFLLENISQIALTSNTKIMQIKPQAQPSQKEKGIEEKGLHLSPIFIKLQLLSGYHQLGQFTSRIERNPLITITDVAIKAPAIELAKPTIELTLKVYVNKK